MVFKFVMMTKSYSSVDGWLQWQRAGKRVEEDVVHKFFMMTKIVIQVWMVGCNGRGRVRG